MTDGETTQVAESQTTPETTAAPETPAAATEVPAQAAEAEKPAETEKPAGAPEKYEFAAPEGKSYDDKTIAAYSEAAKELNLTQEAAQKMLDKLAPAIHDRQMEQIKAVREGWAEASRTDKEIGGDKLTETLSVAKKGLEKFGTPELKTLLDESGLGNHPEIIRAFARAGREISADKVVTGNAVHGNAPAANDPKSLYPNSNLN